MVLLLTRHGTLRAVAEVSGVNYTTVSRRITRAERALGQVLFERLPDGYRATEAAQLIAEHAGRMEAEDHGLQRKLLGQDSAVSGRLTITAPQLVIAHALSPLIRDFTRDHPAVDLRIRATNAIVDLNQRDADLAIRISRDPGDTLKGRRLLRQDTASFAHRDWADRIAIDPGTLIDWILYEGHDGLPAGIDKTYPNHRIRYRFDDMTAMAGAAEAGLGVVRMPMFLGRSLPGLVQVPVLPPQAYADIWAVAHPDVWPSAKLQAFVAPLVRFCKAEQERFTG